MRRRHTVLALTITTAALISACGDDDSGGVGDDQRAVEQAASAYIVEQTADDDAESAGSLKIDSVEIDGDRAEAKASSGASGNRYEVTLTKSGNDWKGLTLFTDVPSEPAGDSGSEDPGAGAGELQSTDDVEKQIQASLLKPLGLEGEVECPPEVKLRRGNNFECKVSGERNATVTVTQKDDKGSLNYNIKVER